VHVFKCGPDFIDPMVLEHASRAKVHTLDLWMVGLEQSRQRLARAAREADVVLVEGVMGLYDGDPSAADLARAFDLPVLAVIDASAMAQTAGAVVLGLRDYGPVRMAGVVANRVASEGHARMVAASLRDIPLLATLPKQARRLPERHLGLVVPGEVADIDSILDELADQLQLDEAQWNALAPQLPDEALPEEPVAPLLAGLTVAIARDAAFCFLYPANVDTLEALGARITWFSPLADEPVPEDADAVYLPGGYPELHGETLAQAGRWQESIRAAHASGLPILAECGGMMVLAESLADKEGRDWPMAGLLPGRVLMQQRLAGLGSQGLATTAGQMRGHTFHYSRLETPLAPAAWTVKHPSGAQGEAVYRVGSLTASYFHAFFASNPAAVASLLQGELE
jgi:cobyrinic acid a,c-diamide synthase